MIGGFLGAGKSTAILRLAKFLSERGQRVGLITNDQSVGLVDTTMLGSHGYAVEEIADGCFCCRFDSLVQAARSLRDAASPDVLIAEPVGSCADLLATVAYPLRRQYGDNYTITPLSVMIDPLRARSMLGLDDDPRFSAKVQYVYTKQLEEANVLVINKCDLIDEEDGQQLVAAMRRRFPNKKLYVVSARDGTGLEDWFNDMASSELVLERTMDIDYDTYAEGEALLGWLNAGYKLVATRPFDARSLSLELAQQMPAELQRHDIEIAHLKMTLSPTNSKDTKPIVLNLVRTDDEPTIASGSAKVALQGNLLLNLRAEADPKLLHETMHRATQLMEKRCSHVTATLNHLQAFRPARPQPTHRISSLNEA